MGCTVPATTGMQIQLLPWKQRPANVSGGFRRYTTTSGIMTLLPNLSYSNSGIVYPRSQSQPRRGWFLC